MKTASSSQIETWNQMIRAGQGIQVARELRTLTSNAIPPNVLARIANLAWRVNQPQVGLRLVYPFLKKSHELKIQVDPEIRAEFAGCLLEVGALSESKLMLKDAVRGAARAGFYQALLCFKEWDYASACPLLENYLATLEESYHRFVVEVNLASAYVVTGRFDEAERLLAQLQEQLRSRGHSLLLGNTYEIASQIPYRRGKHAEALALLAEGEKLLTGTKNMGWLYCKKWEFLNHIVGQGKTSNVNRRVEFEQLRAKAIEMASWETVRELDFHWSLVNQDLNLLTRVYFGSPQVKYRSYVAQRALDFEMDLAQVDSCVISDESAQGSIVATHELENLVMSEGESLHAWLPKKLLLILVSDAYAPFRTGQIFSSLFDGESYDPEGSPDKVFQIVGRLREEIKGNLGAEVSRLDDGYRLKLSAGSAIRKSRHLLELTRLDRTSVYARVLRSRLGEESFTSSELSQKIGASTRSGNRILKALLEESHVLKLGAGRSTKYKMTG